jgi:hypothetical protein
MKGHKLSTLPPGPDFWKKNLNFWNEGNIYQICAIQIKGTLKWIFLCPKIKFVRMCCHAHLPLGKMFGEGEAQISKCSDTTDGRSRHPLSCVHVDCILTTQNACKYNLGGLWLVQTKRFVRGGRHQSFRYERVIPSVASLLHHSVSPLPHLWKWNTDLARRN